MIAGVHLTLVSVHSAVCENYNDVVIYQRSMVDWRRGPWCMCILLYVKLMWCSGML